MSEVIRAPLLQNVPKDRGQSRIPSYSTRGPPLSPPFAASKGRPLHYYTLPTFDKPGEDPAEIPAPDPPTMKRPVLADDPADKRRKMDGEPAAEVGGGETPEFQLDDNLLFEVLSHVDDAQTLAAAACVSHQWRRTAQDERLWELVYTRNLRHPVDCGTQQLRSVVLALGGFRRLHAHCLFPCIKPLPLAASSGSRSSSSSTPQPSAGLLPTPAPAKTANWGKDEVHLSLSLLSIRYYEKMSFDKRGRD